MKLHNLKPVVGSTHKQKRIGRGEGSGHGGTSTRGMNGEGSRSGSKRKVGFEGGQMPIQRRVPKRGFKNFHRKEYKVFNLGQVDALVTKYTMDIFSVENLYMNKLINQFDKVKILAKGELKSKVAFRVDSISEKAKQEVEKVGGTVEVIK
ncbi:MAG: 50S ribosomal protein L15 [Chitinophagaceae bacterium]